MGLADSLASLNDQRAESYKRATVINIEGIDGSGKQTQAIMLAQKLTNEGKKVSIISFPRYNVTEFAKLVSQYLNGEFGELDEIPVYFPALLYAGDRLESMDFIQGAMRDMDVVILDRYVASNLAHQGAKVPEEKREGFIEWLAKVEHVIYRLPVPDVVLYLKTPVSVSQSNVDKKGDRDYTDKKRDLHESNSPYLLKCIETFQLIIHMNVYKKWITVDCMKDINNLRTPEDIHNEIVRELTSETVLEVGIFDDEDYLDFTDGDYTDD